MPPAPGYGPGTELKKLLASIGIKPKTDCGCNARADEMDRNGADWCEENIETIVDWLKEEAKTRPIAGILFTRYAAKQAVKLAITRARKNGENADHPIPKSDITFAVGITSAPRKSPTLNQCVQSVIESGFESPIVYTEPDNNADLDSLPCQVVQNDRLLGCYGNYLATLERLLESHTDAQAIVVFQDDAIIAKDTRRFLEHDLWPSDKCGAVSLYSPNYGTYETTKATGFRRIKSKYLVGALAMVYPRQVAENLVTIHRRWRGCFRGEVIQDETKKKAVDTWIGHAIKGEKKNVYYPSVSLVQHISKHSAVGHGGNSGKRRSGTFQPGKTPFQIFAGHMPKVRFNNDGSMRSAEPLSIVIPACNCSDLTEKCLRALKENADVHPLEVIYVDNGSDDEHFHKIEQLLKDLQFGSHKIIRNDTNLGFCPAANQGMKAATGHVVLLNNDCYIHHKCLSSMYRVMLNNPKVASVGPLTDDQGSQSVVRNPELKKRMGQRKVFSKNMVAGFCQLKRKEVLQEIGYLDENLPHGLGTDDDWCHRARQAGHKILIATDAFASHDHKSTFKRSGQDRRSLQKEACQYLREKGVLK